MRPLFRVEPKMPPALYRTFEISSPLSTHWRMATCTEVECQASQRGWRTVIDTSTPEGAERANYIRLHSGRAYTVAETPGSPHVAFTFPAGQRCFAQHKVRLERPELFVVREGDWRGNPRGTAPRRHSRAEHWVEEFGLHQDRLADRYKQG